jgi:hypothetical protein
MKHDLRLLTMLSCKTALVYGLTNNTSSSDFQSGTVFALSFPTKRLTFAASTYVHSLLYIDFT